MDVQTPRGGPKEKVMITKNYKTFVTGGCRRGLLEPDEGRLPVAEAINILLISVPMHTPHDINSVRCKDLGPFMNDK